MTSAFVEDIRRLAGDSKPLRFGRSLRICLGNYGAQALLGYRLGRWLLRANKKPHLWPLLPLGWPLYFLVSRYVHLAFDIRLHLSADIGPGLYIGHFGNIVLRHCRLGRHCSISQSNHLEPAAEGQPGPTIGERVWIGAHARIVGPFQIGNRSTVSAAAVVQRDIPENALCTGNPARVIMRDYDNSKLINV